MTTLGTFLGRGVHGPAGIVSYAAVLGVAQWALWSWLNSAWPTWARRNRKAIAAVLLVTWAAALLRDARLPVGLSGPLSLLVGADVVWEFAVAAAMILLFAGRLAVRAWSRWLPRLRHPSGEPARSPAQANPSTLPDEAVAEPLAPTRLSRRLALEGIVGTATLGVTTSAFGWGMARGRWDWTTVDVPIRMPRLPRGLDGFTIVQVSDIHTGLFMRDRELADGLSRIARLKPDLVVVTGDIIDRDPQYIPMAARRISEVKARLGVVCIPGNHDYYTGVDLVLEGMRRSGVGVLRNEGRLLLPNEGGGIALLGLDDLWSVRFGLGPDLARAKSMVLPDRPTVLLVHQPQFVERIGGGRSEGGRSEGGRIDLQLSGHTHGGQVYLGAGLASLVSHFVAGRYEVGETTLYVNRGFGTAGPPTRVGVAPEITRIVLLA